MRRGTNIQHGRRRGYPPGVLVPIVIIVVCIPVLIWQLVLVFGAVI